MNKTYEWLYDYYALPLMKVGKQADALKERIVSHGSPADALFLWDRLEEDNLTGLFLRNMKKRMEIAAPEDLAMLERAAWFGLSALEGREEPR